MKPKIPKGWRKMRKGEIIKEGDSYDWNGEWVPFSNVLGEPLSPDPDHISIRRIARKKGGKRK